MAFPSKFKGRGGKKGMRQNDGRKKMSSVKLRPAPAPDASSRRRKRDGDDDGEGEQSATEEEREQEDEDDEEDGLDALNYTKALKGEAKPLAGCAVTVTGCSQVRSQLLDWAGELGAENTNDMSKRTTHLIAGKWGSLKYDMALRWNMQIMLPSWIPAVREAWMNAEDVDYSEIEEAHRFKPFHGSVVSFTQFAQGQHKKDLIRRIEAAGARFEFKLPSDATHLIVASPHSPHSQQPNEEKLARIAERPEQFPHCIIVWEKYVEEVLNMGGRRTDREDVWKWRRGMPEPSDERIAGDSPPPASPEQSSGRGLSRVESSAMLLMQEGLDRDEPLAATTRRTKSRSKAAGGKDGLDVEQLIEAYVAAPIAQRSSEANAASAAPPMAMEWTADAGLQKMNKRESVIKALSTSRSIVDARDVRPKPLSSKALGRSASGVSGAGSSDEACTAGVQDDSAFFEEVSKDAINLPNLKVQPATASSDNGDMPHIFQGLKFALVAMQPHNLLSVKNGLIMLGGEVTVDSEIESADYICVEYLGAPAEFIYSEDPRVITGAWIERCIVEESLQKPGVLLLDRPLPYEFPVPGAEALRVHTTHCTEVEQLHVKRLVRDIGGLFCDSLKPNSTHLVYGNDIEYGGGSAFDFSAPKPSRAEQWGVAVVGIEGLLEWIEEHADKVKRPVKGATLEGKEEVTGSDDVSGPLGDCIVAFSSKIARKDQTRLAEIVSSLGGTVLKSFNDTATHLIHLGTRQTESSSEFKKAREAGAALVHPAWIEKTFSTDTRPSEGDFPHTYDPKKGGQLVGVVSSPPRDPNAARRDSTELSRSVSMSMSRSNSRKSEGPATIKPSRNEPKQLSPAPSMQPAAPDCEPTDLADDEDVSAPRSRACTSAENIGGVMTRQDTPLADVSAPRAGIDSDAATDDMAPARNSSPSPVKQAGPVKPLVDSSSCADSSSPQRLQTNPERPVEPSSDVDMPAALDVEPLKSRSRPLSASNSAAQSLSRTNTAQMLEKQTSLMMEQLGNTVTSAAKPSSRTLRKRNGDGSDTSRSSFSAAAPAAPAPARPPPLPRYLDSEPDAGSQMTQDQEESMCVTFDDPEEAKQRELIQRVLLGGKTQSPATSTRAKRRILQDDAATDESQSLDSASTGPTKRTRKARRA